MKGVMVATRQTPSGGHKVVLIGQPNDHIMDWRGCNFHVLTAPRQPIRGYATREACLSDWATNGMTRAEAEKWAEHKGGTHLSDNTDRQPEFKGIDWRKAAAEEETK